MDPIIEEQASLESIEKLPLQNPAGDPAWREAEHLELDPDEPELLDPEPVGFSGGGMPEAAGQAEDPGTDTDLNERPPRQRINLDQI